jgi:hypothetical protein
MKKLLFLLIFFIGCRNPASDMGLSQIQVSNTLESGQSIAYVEYNSLGVWIQSHKNIDINTISSVDKDSYGQTSGFIIVYKEIK